LLRYYCIAKLLTLHFIIYRKKRGLPHSLGQTSKYGNVIFHCDILDDKMNMKKTLSVALEFAMKLFDD